jgi:hypothetical protein
MAEIIRVLVPLDSHAAGTIQTAIEYAKVMCAKTGSRDIILLTHNKSVLEHTSLADNLGDHTVRALAKGPVSVSAGINLQAETRRTLRRLRCPAVIIVYYAESEILDLVDGAQNVAGVVAVPDYPGRADGWAERWNVSIHGQVRPAPVTLIDDPVVVRALEELTEVINLSTGLIHPRDKEMADEFLRILRAKGHANPTPKIRSWAIRNGWKPYHAVKLEALSRRIWYLKANHRLSKFHNPHVRYDRWFTGDGAVRANG